jgi:hypothetical protein
MLLKNKIRMAAMMFRLAFTYFSPLEVKSHNCMFEIAGCNYPKVLMHPCNAYLWFWMFNEEFRDEFRRRNGISAM